MSLVIAGNAAASVISALSVMVSAPLPAAQPLVALSLLAEVMASARLQELPTAMLAA